MVVGASFATKHQVQHQLGQKLPLRKWQWIEILRCVNLVRAQEECEVASLFQALPIQWQVFRVTALPGLWS